MLEDDYPQLKPAVGRGELGTWVMKPVVRRSSIQQLYVIILFMEVYKSVQQERMRPPRTAHSGTGTDKRASLKSGHARVSGALRT